MTDVLTQVLANDIRPAVEAVAQQFWRTKQISALNPLAVENDDLILSGLDGADLALIKDLLARHVEHTGSALAASPVSM